MFQKYLLKPTANSNNCKSHNEDAGLHQDTEFECVTEDILKESVTKNISYSFRIFSQQENKYPHNF